MLTRNVFKDEALADYIVNEYSFYTEEGYFEGLGETISLQEKEAIEEETYLNIDKEGVKSLDGLELLVNLEYIYLSRNNISDISPLQNGNCNSFLYRELSYFWRDASYSLGVIFNFV